MRSLQDIVMIELILFEACQITNNDLFGSKWWIIYYKMKFNSHLKNLKLNVT